MKIVNEPLLKLFRQKPHCEICGRRSDGWLDPHHIHAKGMGAGHRMDHRFNLLAVCRCCHNKIHMANLTIDGRAATKEDLLFIVAQREGVAQESIEMVLHLIQRLPKDASLPQMSRSVALLPMADRKVCWDTLKEMGKVT